MIFTPTYDNLSERESWRNLVYNALIDDLQAKKIMGGDFDYPFTHSGSIGLNGSSLYGVGNFGSPTSANASAIRIANGLGFYPGNSASDNASAIQAIIDGLSTYGTIWLGPGVYLVDSSIVVNGSAGTVSGYTLKGQGIDVTTIQAASGIGNSSAVLQMAQAPTSNTATSITIRDLTIDANQLAGIGIDGQSMSKCRFINVKIANADDGTTDGNGLVLANAVDCHFQNVVIEDVDGNAIYVTNANGTCNKNRFSNIYIDTPGVDGMKFDPLGSENSFAGMVIQDAVGNGINFSATGSSNNVFKDIVIADAGAIGVYGEATGDNDRWENVSIHNPTSYGFRFEGASGDAVVDISCINCSVTDNGFSAFSFEHDQATGSMLNILVSGCSARGSAAHGLYIEGEDQPSHTIAGVVVQGCQFNGNTGSGIRIDNGVSHITVTGNVCYANTVNGIQIFTDTARDFWATLTGNACSNNGAYGIVLEADVDQVILQGNVANGNGTDQFFENASAGANNYVVQTTSNTVCNMPAATT